MRAVLAGLTLVALVLVTCAQPEPVVRRAGGTAPSSTSRPAATSGATAAPAAGGAASAAPAVPAKPAVAISRSAADVPPPLTRAEPAKVVVNLETKEVEGVLADGESYTYWTFGGTVPGPMLRVRVGDTVELHVKNPTGGAAAHSIDLHAVTGPGGGAVATQTDPGKETMFTFKALNPGLFVYHCATAPIPVHVSNGMYGLILVEPAGGLPKVDREFYVMQGEVYSVQPFGTKGHHDFNGDKMLAENPDYVLFNGAVGALTGNGALKANVGETVRIYFGVGGFVPSSFHVIGEIFDKVYPEGAVGSTPNANVQTTFVPAGGATIVEFKVEVPGSFTLVDHTLTRALMKGAAGVLTVSGPADPTIFSGPLSGAGH